MRPRGGRRSTLNLSVMQSDVALHTKPPKGTSMNTDQIKGAAKQVEGSIQKNYGDAKENLKDASK